MTPQKAQLLAVYHAEVASKGVEPCQELQALLVKKSSKSQSGVLVRGRRSVKREPPGNKSLFV